MSSLKLLFLSHVEINSQGPHVWGPWERVEGEGRRGEGSAKNIYSSKQENNTKNSTVGYTESLHRGYLELMDVVPPKLDTLNSSFLFPSRLFPWQTWVLFLPVKLFYASSLGGIMEYLSSVTSLLH